jgi:hypothetical protein
MQSRYGNLPHQFGNAKDLTPRKDRGEFFGGIREIPQKKPTTKKQVSMESICSIIGVSAPTVAIDEIVIPEIRRWYPNAS